MENFFKNLLEYTYTFNDKVIESLIILENAPEKSIKLINHTVNSHEIWNSRVENSRTELGVWDVNPLDELKVRNKANYEKTLGIVDTADFGKKIIYTNTKGQTFENSIGDILFHVINHSTYHRAQIATDYKSNNIQPLITDYIFYKREEL